MYGLAFFGEEDPLPHELSCKDGLRMDRITQRAPSSMTSFLLTPIAIPCQQQPVFPTRLFAPVSSCTKYHARYVPFKAEKMRLVFRR